MAIEVGACEIDRVPRLVRELREEQAGWKHAGYQGSRYATPGARTTGRLMM